MSLGFPLQYIAHVKQALQEDLGQAGDLTSNAIVAPECSACASIIMRKSGRVCGLDVALSAFSLLDKHIKVEKCNKDGDDVQPHTTVARIQGNARAILAAERTALNFFARLSGIATATAQAVAQLSDLAVQITCTRKTTPGLRRLEKYAVRIGGGANHRFGLYDAVLIKDNHRIIVGSITQAVTQVRQTVGHMVKVEVEVDTIQELKEALAIGVDLVLLDNMDIPQLEEAVALCQKEAITEASGGITPANLRSVAQTGVDLISLGWLTHSVPALDVALDIER